MTLQVVVGGQFGSEAKGAVTAAICNREAELGQDVTVVRIGGPNAGHSAVDKAGRLWALRQIPCGMVVDPEVLGVIADGSEIDWDVLLGEVEALENAGHGIRSRLIVSTEATMITDQHKVMEAELVGRIGSTGKGIGAARSARVLRQAPRVVDYQATFDRAGIRTLRGPVVAAMLNQDALGLNSTVVIEGTQGYGLGLHAGYYPQCTSSDCRAVDFLSMAGINPWGGVEPKVHVVVRPYPIRVAGNSGPLKGETTWADLGLKPELTTVTKKVRRVGTWDLDLVMAALIANGPGARLAVSMVDQVPGLTDPDNSRDGLSPKGLDWLIDLEKETGATVDWYGVGPTLADWRLL